MAIISISSQRWQTSNKSCILYINFMYWNNQPRISCKGDRLTYNCNDPLPTQILPNHPSLCQRWYFKLGYLNVEFLKIFSTYPSRLIFGDICTKLRYPHTTQQSTHLLGWGSHNVNCYPLCPARKTMKTISGAKVHLTAYWHEHTGHLIQTWIFPHKTRCPLGRSQISF